MLPQPFVQVLAGHEELIVSSREDGREHSVRAWYVVLPQTTPAPLGEEKVGIVYLFTYSFALRVARWRKDPWVRLRVPDGGPWVEGTVHFVTADELDDSLTEAVIERWWMWGATTSEGLHRMLRDGSHVLVRVDPTNH